MTDYREYPLKSDSHLSRTQRNFQNTIKTQLSRNSDSDSDLCGIDGICVVNRHRERNNMVYSLYFIDFHNKNYWNSISQRKNRACGARSSPKSNITNIIPKYIESDLSHFSLKSDRKNEVRVSLKSTPT